MSDSIWKKCSSCKKPIHFKAVYWVCNVSTCNSKRLGLSFCSVSCWDAHLPLMNHREAWAEERRAPTSEDWQKTLSGENKPVRTRVKAESTPQVEASKNQAPQTTKVLLRKKNSSAAGSSE